MKFLSIRSIREGERFPDAWMWLAIAEPRIWLTQRCLSNYLWVVNANLYDYTVAGITIPLPWPFWHYTPERFDEEYAYWSITFAIRRDDWPIKDGKLPRIKAEYWYSWRKPACQKLTITRKSAC